MTLQQALTASTALCALQRLEPDHEHAYSRVVIVLCKLPHDWWVYEYRQVDGTFTGWLMNGALAAENYVDACLHAPRDHGWSPASGLLDAQALSGVSTPNTMR